MLLHRLGYLVIIVSTIAADLTDIAPGELGAGVVSPP